MPDLHAQSPASPSWDQFRAWAREENVYQRQIAGVHARDHSNPELRDRTYFEVNVYRYFHCLGVCWPYLTQRHGHKMLDVGSWPGVWMRAVAHFCRDYHHDIYATGLLFPDQFLEKMNGACRGIIKCELDPHSPMADRSASSSLTESGFTFVTAMEVVEHLYYPRSMFDILSASMAVGGILVLTTNNVARLQNLAALISGDGLVPNLDELLPVGGGQLGAWRPHAREYAWRELNHIAMQAGFEHVDHGFYQENYGLRLIEGKDQINDTVACSNEREHRLVEAMRSALVEQDQLKSGMYLILRKVI